jgi:predicted SAM-dependent methyltransferase
MRRIKALLVRWVSKRFPPYVLNPLRSEWHVWKYAHLARKPAPFVPSGPVYINAGAGVSGREGWLNVDACPYPGINRLQDLRKGFPPDLLSQADGIYTEHFVEHLSYEEEVPRFLASAISTLKPGGVLRIIVPDARKYMSAYFAEGWGDMTKVRSLKDGNLDDSVHPPVRRATKMEFVNEVFRQSGQHQFAWDFETLALAMGKAGFVDIAECQFGVGRDPKLLIDLPQRAFDSLYVEGRRPEIGSAMTPQ